MKTDSVDTQDARAFSIEAQAGRYRDCLPKNGRIEVVEEHERFLTAEEIEAVFGGDEAGERLRALRGGN